MISRRALVSLRQQAAGSARKTNIIGARFSAATPSSTSLFHQRRFSLRNLFSSSSTWVSITDNKIDNGVLLVRGLATRSADSSANRPPKETILLDGCDFEHWLVVMEPPDPNLTRDEIIDSYLKTLAQVVGSEEEARRKIYSVSTRHYFAFGALVSEELSYKIKELPKVRWVLPDSYLDVKNKSYGGEPFIDGQAVPYDPKYHEEWVRNNARANERSRRNDRPRNFDRSRNFERRRENMNRDMSPPAPPPPMPKPEFQNQGASRQDMPSPVQNTGFQSKFMPPPVQNTSLQSKDLPPPVQNSGFQSNGMPPPMQNHDFHGKDMNMPPPTQNWNAQSSVPPPAQNWNSQSSMQPPTQNMNSQNRGMPPLQQSWNAQSNMPPPPQNWNAQSSTPPQPNWNAQSRNIPPAPQNWNAQSRDIPPPPQNWNAQSRDIPPPPQNWNAQSRDAGMQSPTQNWNSQGGDVKMEPPTPSWNSQGRNMNMPPSTQNWNPQSRDIPPPAHNQEFQSRDMRAPIQNWDAQTSGLGNAPNVNYQNRDPAMGGGFPNRDQMKNTPSNITMGNVQGRDYQSRDIPGNIGINTENRDHQERDQTEQNMANTSRDYQTRDMPSENYEYAANRSF
ncbi:hypothetical protein NE237_003286 [Protea cynaroides]|uniref:MORF/ORRM1/DAG-like MORF domain-containing protein n=1 Tax=Protea cynaroides TaxID=273540 RepID=A0A9Q0KGP2_9MAGN|nr:hypothetical protein NE237_003286 [Protea cynaroides]